MRSRRSPQPLKGLCRLSRLATGSYKLGALYKARKREEGRKTGWEGYKSHFPLSGCAYPAVFQVSVAKAFIACRPLV